MPLTFFRRYTHFIFICLLIASSLTLRAEKETLDSVLKKYHTAMGGQQRLKSIQSVIFSAKILQNKKPIGTLRVIKKSPNLVRRTLAFPDGTETILAYDGSTVWSEQSKGYHHKIMTIDDDTSRAFVRDASIGGPLVDLDGDFTLTYHGIVPLENGTKCHHIEAVYTGGWTHISYYIDAQEFVERKYVTTEQLDGKTVKTEYIPSDYKWVNGILFAYKIIQRSAEGATSEITIDEIRLNDGVFDTIFQMPTKP